MDSRPRRNRAVVALLVALSSMLLVLPTNAHARNKVQTRRRDRVTNGSDEGGPYTMRVRVSPFSIRLSPTPNSLSESAETEILDALQQKIGREQSLPEGVSLVYVWLAGVSQNTFLAADNPSVRRLETTDASTILFVDGGTASFQVEEGASPPERSEVEGWVETTVNEALVAELQQSPLGYITSSGYLAVTPSPTAAPLLVGGVGLEETNGDGDSENAGLIIGATVGAVLAVGVLAAFFLVGRRKHSKKQSLEMADTFDIDESPDASFEDEDQNDNDPAPSVDARYGADVASVASEGTVSSSHTNKSGDTRPSVSLPAERTESFELDRQVMIRKDMLHFSPAWNSESLIHTGGAETVLQPSYFSARTEMERRLLRQDENQCSSSHDLAADETKSKDDDLFLFEANGGGEEMYILPPSRIQGR